MNPHVSEWLNLILRWIHVYAGILWVGQTFFFTKLDLRLAAAEKAGGKENDPARVWMVHSGGFYVVEKQKVTEILPPKLHWFRWEAAITWLSGILLLGIVYHMGGILVDRDIADLSVGTASTIGLAVLLVGWAVYDLLWQSPLARWERLGGVISYLLLVGIAFGLGWWLSGRAAYIHVGSLMGTVMTANVWMRILPAQRRMITAVQQGKSPDLALAARAKLRSKHNTYMALPVVFLMVSNHFPTATYGSQYGWVILALLVLVGFGAAKVVRDW